MRNAIRNRIISQVSVLKQNVFQPNMATKDTAKPYAVIKFAGDSLGEVRHSFSRSIEVWVYTSKTNYNTIDGIVDSIITALNHFELTTAAVAPAVGTKFALECIGISPDGFQDPDLEALTKTIYFTYDFIKKY